MFCELNKNFCGTPTEIVHVGVNVMMIFIFNATFCFCLDLVYLSDWQSPLIQIWNTSIQYTSPPKLKSAQADQKLNKLQNTH